MLEILKKENHTALLRQICGGCALHLLMHALRLRHAPTGALLQNVVPPTNKKLQVRIAVSMEMNLPECVLRLSNTPEESFANPYRQHSSKWTCVRILLH